MTFEPELGQMVFGQPYKKYGVPEIMEAVLDKISGELKRVHWNIFQEELIDPFGNTGASYGSDVFSVEAYSWNEDYEQPWNFKYGDLEISWYKYCGRGMSANREISPGLAVEVLEKCLEHLRSREAAV